MTNIKVSVLTPLYNHAGKYVRKCLESLQAQTLQEIEFILIDNGANEENKALITEFLEKDSRFRALRFEDKDIAVKDIRFELYANVTFTHGIYENRQIVHDYLTAQGIDSIGRFGKWDYLWSHQAFESGMDL